MSDANLEFLRTCALLHDIGKPECWANEKPWSDHIHWTFRFVKECLGEKYALAAMRHHSGPSYPTEYHPKEEFEQIICLADNFSSGADRREVPEHGAPHPKPPIFLTHVLSDGSVVRKSFDAARLAYMSRVLQQRMKEVGDSFIHEPREKYIKIFEILNGSELHSIPADTRKPINDVSLWNHLKLTAAFATCIWLDGGYKGDNYQKYDFALLSGDADRISSYIGISRRLPDLNARSEKIKKATRSAADLLTSLLGPECLIFAAGGSFLALSPKGRAMEVLGKVKEVFEDSTQRQVTITVNHVVANGEEVMEKFGRVWEKAQLEMRVKKDQREISPLISIEGGVDVCDVCHSRSWSYEDRLRMLPVDASPRHERLCESCWRLRGEGKGVELDALKGKTNFVALIKADGDDMGKVLRGDRFAQLKKANTPSRLSALSDLISLTCEDELEEVVEKFGGECLFAGGDDVFAFVPGENALEAAMNVASKFRSEMAEQCSMSVGVAFFRYDLPVYVGLETAEYLLRRAKEEKNRVAYAVVGASGITASELDEFVKPRRWDELQELLKIVNFMGGSGAAASQLRRIAGLSNKNLERAEALIKNLMGRGTIGWKDGESLLNHLETGLLSEAFMVYNLFRRVIE